MFSPHSKPLPWWAWRRRAARLRLLECVARTEIRLSLNGYDQVARTFEACYLALTENAEMDIFRGVSWVTLASIGNDHGDQAAIHLRLPLQVGL